MNKFATWMVVLTLGLMAVACGYEEEKSNDTAVKSSVASPEVMAKVHGPGTYVVTVEGMS